VDEALFLLYFSGPNLLIEQHTIRYMDGSTSTLANTIHRKNTHRKIGIVKGHIFGFFF
jgi:hypothetical protein